MERHHSNPIKYKSLRKIMRTFSNNDDIYIGKQAGEQLGIKVLDHVIIGKNTY